jgi:uncharacterized membrane protein
MKQPKLEIGKDALDYVLDVCAFILAVILVGLPLYYYGDMEDSIPTHFNAKGMADGFGSKKLIWVLPTLGIMSFILLFSLNGYAHKFNYPSKITKENALRQYRRATRMIRWLSVFILFSFVYIVWIGIQNGLNNPSQLGHWFTPVLLIGILAICFWPIILRKK